MATAKCGTIISMMEEIAPKNLAEDWDNVGLIIGDGSKKVKKLFICLDLPEWVLDEAIGAQADMIITHHPFIFNGIKSINTDSSLGRKIIKLIKNDISVYSSHTNYDIAEGGLNDIFAKKLGFNKSNLIRIHKSEKLYKIVVYVPKGEEKKVLDSLLKSGAGFIGNYSYCSFRSEGIGTFKPGMDTNPYIGQIGKMEEVEESKIETIIPETALKKAIKEMLKAHPYEEVAYDVYELKNEGKAFGIGRIGELSNSETLLNYAESVKKALCLKSIRYAGEPDSLIKKVALINGSGSKYIRQAKLAGADVLITGDMQYHQILDALESGLSIIDAGHFDTEVFMIEAISDYLKEKLSNGRYDIDIIESKTNYNPVKEV